MREKNFRCDTGRRANFFRSFPPFLFLIFTWITLHNVCFAAGTEFQPKVWSKEECVSTIESLLYPEAVIKKGIGNLQAITATAYFKIEQCLASIVGPKWKVLFPTPTLEISRSASADDALRRVTKSINATKRNYELRGLLSRFHAFLLSEQKIQGIDGFCADNEARLQLDEKYSKTHFYNQMRFQTDDQWKLASEYGLTETEYGAIWTYTGTGSEEINPALFRKKQLTYDQNLFKEELTTAVSKCPQYSAAQLQRQEFVTDDRTPTYTPGAVVDNAAFISTTRLKKWAWGGNFTYFIFPGTRAHDISAVRGGQEEVIFLPGTKFKVLSREETSPGHFKVLLAETDENGNVVADINLPEPDR